jgi:hypothetical protein
MAATIKLTHYRNASSIVSVACLLEVSDGDPLEVAIPELRTNHLQVNFGMIPQAEAAF